MARPCSPRRSTSESHKSKNRHPGHGALGKGTRVSGGPNGEAHRAVREPEDPAAFEEYYANTHMALVDKIPSFQRYEVARIIATPDGTETPYYRIFEIYFDDTERLQSSLSTPEGQAPPNDISNFATGGAKLFISEVDS
jgi:uncharacterized protein (TIGR02118 family)